VVYNAKGCKIVELSEAIRQEGRADQAGGGCLREEEEGYHEHGRIKDESATEERRRIKEKRFIKEEGAI
jgi:hypothetical protein